MFVSFPFPFWSITFWSNCKHSAGFTFLLLHLHLVYGNLTYKASCAFMVSRFVHRVLCTLRYLQIYIILSDLWLLGNFCSAFAYLKVLLTVLHFCFHVYSAFSASSSFQTSHLSRLTSSQIAIFCFSQENRNYEDALLYTILGAQNFVSVLSLVYLVVLLSHWIEI